MWIVVSASDCSVRGPRFKSHHGQLRSSQQPRICSLGHGLHTSTTVPRSTQPCIPLGLLNKIEYQLCWGKGRNVTSARWQVTLCDPTWNVSSHSSEAMYVANCYIHLLTSTCFTKVPLEISDRFYGPHILPITPSLPHQYQQRNSTKTT